MLLGTRRVSLRFQMLNRAMSRQWVFITPIVLLIHIGFGPQVHIAFIIEVKRLHFCGLERSFLLLQLLSELALLLFEIGHFPGLFRLERKNGLVKPSSLR